MPPPSPPIPAPAGPEAPSSVPELLERVALARPGRGVTLLDRRGRPERRLTWPELRRAALDLAPRLRRAGAVPGAPVVLAQGTSLELLEEWLACVLAGALPLIAAPPLGAGAGTRELAKLASTARRLDAPLILAPPSVAEALEEAGESDLAGRVLGARHLRSLAPAAGAPAAPAPEEPAFLQLTSGSTGRPRAALVRHGSVVHQGLANDLAIGASGGAPASAAVERLVSWLPLHHDMGLVGCFLYALSAGFELELMAPRSFLARPMAWLQALGRGAPALAPAPNFAYRTLVERLEPAALAGVDLGAWRHALVGAEMVGPALGEDLDRALGPHGLARGALVPCYGLAEATLSVTFDQRGEGPRTRPRPLGAGPGPGEVVSSGEPIADTELELRAPDGAPVAEGHEGEVWVRGPGVFAGYLGDPEATAEALVGGWLRTGDLGFLHGAELYLTGRVKDLLVLRGQNWMPHELEWCAEQVTGGGGQCRSAAFSVRRGEEGEVPVLVLETAEQDAQVLGRIEREVRVRLGRELGLVLADLRLVRRGRLPKTSSGKVQRREVARRYLAGELDGELTSARPGA